jgi:NAD(P)-dependent dehydrogenase (short-subunit alcohol dehydrogenase family)
VTPGTTARNGTLLEMSDEDWEANFQDVLMSAVRSCRAILPHLLENGGGTLVTTAAYSARSAKSFLFAYAALKAAIVNFTKNLAKTYGGQGIRANCVCPGAIETEVLQTHRKAAALEHGLPEERALEHVMFEVWKMPVAQKRVGRPQEVGELMAFLLSDRAAYMTGATINIDGGTDF